YSRAKRDYDRAVDIYNDSLGVRLGLYTPDGKYIAPRGALVDKDGYIILDQPEDVAEPKPEGPEPPPVDEATPPVDEAAPPAEPPPENAPPSDPAAPAEAISPTPGAGLLQMRR